MTKNLSRKTVLFAAIALISIIFFSTIAFAEDCQGPEGADNCTAWCTAKGYRSTVYGGSSEFLECLLLIISSCDPNTCYRGVGTDNCWGCCCTNACGTGETPCGVDCCPSGQQCLANPSNGALTCCASANACSAWCCSGPGQCCNDFCCNPSYGQCIGGTTCCENSQICGSACCANGEYCANASASKCCANGQILCGNQCCNGQCVGGTCCPNGQVCGTACCQSPKVCAGPNTCCTLNQFYMAPGTSVPPFWYCSAVSNPNGCCMDKIMCPSCCLPPCSGGAACCNGGCCSSGSVCCGSSGCCDTSTHVCETFVVYPDGTNPQMVSQCIDKCPAGQYLCGQGASGHICCNNDQKCFVPCPVGHTGFQCMMTPVCSSNDTHMDCTGTPATCQSVSGAGEDDCTGCCSPGQTACGDPVVCCDNETQECVNGKCEKKCSSASQCYDGNPCTTDSCGSNGFCSNISNGGTVCGSNCCTSQQSCNLATFSCEPKCTSSSQCDDSDPCTTDSCDSGVCTHSNTSGGTPCGSNCCTGGKVCNAQTLTCEDECTDSSQCDDSNPCTNDSCNTTTGQCEHSSKNCSDGDPCTTDSCNSTTGGCEHTSKSCDDGNPCTTDSCNSTTGACENTATGIPCDSIPCCALDKGCINNTSCGNCTQDTECNDKNPCTIDMCNALTGACSYGQKNCNDGNPCTADGCNSSTGECVHTKTGNLCDNIPCCPIDKPCKDNKCGNCTQDSECNDNDACTTDSCNTSTGSCEYTAKNCDDGLLCTVDSCDSSTGACRHSQKNCDDWDLCTTDSCNSATGACQHSQKNCDDGNPCTNDSCNSGTGNCEHTSTGIPCDSIPCCALDKGCINNTSCGNCTQDTECNDKNPCTTDACNEETGACQHLTITGLQCGEACCPLEKQCVNDSTCMDCPTTLCGGKCCSSEQICINNSCVQGKGSYCNRITKKCVASLTEGRGCSSDLECLYDTCGNGSMDIGEECEPALNNCPIGLTCVNCECVYTTGASCIGNICMPDATNTLNCQSSNDCTTHNICDKCKCTAVEGTGINQCSGDADCTTKKNVCIGQICTETTGNCGESTCTTSADCVERRCNNLQQCVEGGTGIECSNSLQCLAARCTLAEPWECGFGNPGKICTTPEDCLTNETFCDEAGQCVKNGPGQGCVISEDCSASSCGNGTCEAGEQCGDFGCTGCSIGQSCVNCQCKSGTGTYCDGRICREKPTAGNECATNADCSGIFCGDGEIGIGEQCETDSDCFLVYGPGYSCIDCRCYQDETNAKFRFLSFDVYPSGVFKGENPNEIIAVIENLKDQQINGCKVSIAFVGQDYSAAGARTISKTVDFGREEIKRVTFSPSDAPQAYTNRLDQNLYMGKASILCDNKKQAGAIDNFAIIEVKQAAIPETNLAGIGIIILGILLVFKFAGKRKKK